MPRPSSLAGNPGGRKSWSYVLQAEAKPFSPVIGLKTPLLPSAVQVQKNPHLAGKDKGPSPGVTQGNAQIDVDRFARERHWATIQRVIPGGGRKMRGEKSGAERGRRASDGQGIRLEDLRSHHGTRNLSSGVSYNRTDFSPELTFGSCFLIWVGESRQRSSASSQLRQIPWLIGCDPSRMVLPHQAQITFMPSPADSFRSLP